MKDGESSGVCRGPASFDFAARPNDSLLACISSGRMTQTGRMEPAAAPVTANAYSRPIRGLGGRQQSGGAGNTSNSITSL